MAEEGAGTPPGTPKGKQTSKSRFFCPQKKRPWDESDQVERIEILSETAAPKNDAPINNAAKSPAPHQNEENNSSVQLEHESVEQGTAAANPNPFAQFAFGGASSKAPHDAHAASTTKKKKWTTVSTSNKNKKKKKACVNNKEEKRKDWIRMVDCSKEVQERIVEKWHSLADPNAPLEVRRFQVLVAARLHARCQEPVVRRCMESLRTKYQPLDAATLSKVNPDELAESLSSLQYYNVKAKHVVAAANEIQHQFLGKVPEKESELRTITGIGPVMSDLLAFVNTVERHNRPDTHGSDGKGTAA